MALKPNKNPAEVNAGVEVLLEAIKNSEICQRYEQAKARISERPELYASVNEFRRKAYMLQQERDIMTYRGETGNLYQKRLDFRDEELANEFLEAELEICRLLQRISLDIIGSVDLDLTSFEDAING